MAAIKHFAAPAGLTTPPLSFAARTGDLLFVSGIPGFDENGALPDTFEAQFGFVVRNMTRASDVGTMNALYASAFGPAPYPARTTCVVQALPNPTMLIEIECVASLAGR
jgi:2-iminobutanoate/2-iminopropanoate deaminase